MSRNDFGIELCAALGLADATVYRLELTVEPGGVCRAVAYLRADTRAAAAVLRQFEVKARPLPDPVDQAEEGKGMLV